MPRTDLTVTTAKTPYEHAGVAVTMTAADVANMNQATFTGSEIIIAQNTGGVSYTVTITSASDPYGRTKDITAESLAAGEIRVYNMRAAPGWQQTDGKLYFQANNAAVKFGIIKLP